MPDDTLSTIIIDDHTLFRSGLHELLERRGIRVLGTAGDTQSGMALIRETNPDVVLLDLRMPGGGGLEILSQLSNEMQAATYVVLTTSDDTKDLMEAFRLGASGYLLKDMEPDHLVASLLKVQQGEVVVAPDLANILANTAIDRGVDDRDTDNLDDDVKKLTPRELEILCHIANGESNKEIAWHLGITDGTVKLHVRAIMRKLGVRSRVEAAVLAVTRGVCQDKPARFQ